MGVYSFGYNQIYIEGNKFINIVPIDNSNTSTNNYSNAIYCASDISSPLGINIINNNIEGYRRGIQLINQKADVVENVKICDNKINLINPINTVQNFIIWGIRLENCENPILLNNTIKGRSNLYWQTYGIDLRNTPGAQIYCNDINRTGLALSCQGDMPGSNIKKNKFYSSMVGFNLDQGCVYNQGQPGNPNDNKWLGSFVAHTKSYKSIGQNTHFFVRDQQNYKPTNNIVDPPNNPLFSAVDIIITTGSSNYICGSDITQNLAYSSLLNGVTIDSLNFTTDVGLKWQSKQAAFKHLKNNTDLLQNPINNSFYHLNKQKAIGKLDTIAYLVTDNKIAEAISVLNQTNTENLVDVNEKQLTGMVLNALLDTTNAKFNINDIVFIRNLALACPTEAGTIVYSARSILYNLGDTRVYYNECEFTDMQTTIANRLIHSTCEPVQTIIPINETNEVNSISNEFQFAIYPNPTQSNPSIVYQNHTNSVYTLNIFNVCGNCIATIQLNNTSAEKTINLIEKSAGIYFYTISNSNNNDFRKGKIIYLKN